MSISIHVVDDSEFARKFLIKTISAYSGQKDLTISVAGNGIEALELLEKEIPNLMFLDLTMPEMDGYELLEELGRRNISFPIVVISADIQSEAVRKVKDKGVLAFLGKPVKSDEFTGLMKEINII